MLSTMASRRIAVSSYIDQQSMDPDLFIGFHFDPTYEEWIRIVHRKNAGGTQLLPIFIEHDRLFQCGPEQLGECYCFTKLELAKNKVKRTLRDGSGRYWKNRKSEFVRDANKNKIGCVTQLVLHKENNTTTEWHISEYRDTVEADAGRWVLCQIYKREKNNDNATVPHVAGQISSSTLQVSSLWASDARGDMNQVQHYEMGECSNTQPDWFSNAATNPDLTGGHMNQDQIHSVGQSWYTPQDSMVYNSQQFLSSPNSIVDFDMGLFNDQFIN